MAYNKTSTTSTAYAVPLADDNGKINAGYLPAGLNANLIADGSVSDTEFQYLNGATSNLQTQIDNIIQFQTQQKANEITTTHYTIDASTDNTIICTVDDTLVTLPALADCYDGQEFTVKNFTGLTITTVITQNSEVIVGSNAISGTNSLTFRVGNGTFLTI